LVKVTTGRSYFHNQCSQCVCAGSYAENYAINMGGFMTPWVYKMKLEKTQFAPSACKAPTNVQYQRKFRNYM